MHVIMNVHNIMYSRQGPRILEEFFDRSKYKAIQRRDIMIHTLETSENHIGVKSCIVRLRLGALSQKSQRGRGEFFEKFNLSETKYAKIKLHALTL